MNAIDAPNFKPLKDHIFVRRDAPDAEKGGIIIPENVQTYGWRATVIRSGPDAKEYVKGDVILFLKEFTVLPFKDRTLAVTNANHVLAKLETVKNFEAIIPQNKFVMIAPDRVRENSAGIYLSDKARLPPKTGHIVAKGPDCKDVIVGNKAWFPPCIGVNCVEDGENYKLIDESDILMMEEA